MSDVSPEAMQQTSDYASEMVAQGFRPNDVDISAMMAQIQKLQSTVDALNAERGVPLDPIDGHRKHLWAHLTLRDAARPDVDMTEVKNVLSALPEVSDSITAKMTEALHFAMEQLLKAHPGKELEYLTTLTAELHQMALNREGKASHAHDRFAELEAELASLRAMMSGQQTEAQPNG